MWLGFFTSDNFFLEIIEAGGRSKEKTIKIFTIKKKKQKQKKKKKNNKKLALKKKNLN